MGDLSAQALSDMSLAEEFKRIGRDMFLSGAVTSHGGNLSVSDGKGIWITRTNCMIGHIEVGDIVSTGMEPGPADEGASRELVVHRAMYEGYFASVSPDSLRRAAIAHSHSRSTIARTLSGKSIRPKDSEGAYTLGLSDVAVFDPRESIGSDEAAEMLGAFVAGGGRIACLKGHGPFAIADTLEGAFRLISVLEASCEILNALDAL